MPTDFSSRDIEDIRARGLTVEEVQRQESLLRAPPPPPILDRPCAEGDGVSRIKPEETASYTHLFDKAREEGRLSKFIPASGAATRMFKSLMAIRARRADVFRRDLEKDAGDGDADAAETRRFILGLPRFAFFEDLRALLRQKKIDDSPAPADGRYTPWLDLLLSPEGLNLPALPKALIPFHRSGKEVRTALEEHLIESVDTLRSGEGLCRIHFTASPEHEGLVRNRMKDILPRLEKLRRCRYEAGVSVQKPSTDTVALGTDGHPARSEDGRLLFRPGGHGALLSNLNDLKGDVVFIKNIDNVPHESYPGETSHWDALLAGLLIDLQFHMFQRSSWLAGRPKDLRILAEAEEFAARRLNIQPPPGHAEKSVSDRREWLLTRLNRPLRVCAVVKNAGEPGGGPFWTRGTDGELSPQIVEAAQVSADSGQKKIFASSKYFNPVHMVCGLRDSQGKNFDLSRFTDTDAVFTAEKSWEGRPLRALERPGLWNGAMARWSTVFVEAPVSTFHPAKTLSDLLRPDHQPS